MSFWTPTIGQRVRVKSLDIKGTVEHIDYPNLTRDIMYPIQVKLDKPYYEPDIPNAYMYRTGVGDLKKLIKKKTDKEKPKVKKKKKKVSFDEMAW